MKYTFQFEMTDNEDQLNVKMNDKAIQLRPLSAALNIAASDYRNMYDEAPWTGGISEAFKTTKLLPNFMTGRKKKINNRLKDENVNLPLFSITSFDLTIATARSLLHLLQQKNHGKGKASFNFKIIYYLIQISLGGKKINDKEAEEIVNSFTQSLEEFIKQQPRLGEDQKSKLNAY